MALATLQLAAIPVVAGLLAGSGAIAAFIAAPNGAVSAPAPSPVPQNLPCAAQTWPYIDQSCIPSASGQKRTVRLVNAPRGGEAGEAAARAPVSSTGSAAAARAAEPSLTTSDTVLRAPQQVAPRNAERQAAKPRTRRSDTRRQRDRRWAAQSYQVPSELQGRGATPVIVVRPLRLEAFR
jgi:hypothetical protein